VLAVCLAACGRLDFDTGDEFSFPSFTVCPSTIALVGTTQCSNGMLELTPDASSVAGAAWFATPYPITSTTRLSVAIAFQFTNQGGLGADGMTIALSGDPRGTSAVGSTGGSLGYDMIKPSAALELDDHLNSSYCDINGNHLGIDRDGSLVSLVAQDAAPLQLGGGAVLYAWLDYDGPTTTLSGYLSAAATKPGAPLVTTTDDLSRLRNAWVGVTAGTGVISQRSDVLSWRFDYTP
jgi:hypothetical protein